MSKTVFITIKEKKMRIKYSDGNDNQKEKIFKIKTRKQKLTKRQARENNPYQADFYWKNGGPCPPGNYYLFYRYRIENGRNRNRLEFCQTKPDKLIINEDDKKNAEILKKQGYLKFKNSADRMNIQIHGGNKSKGCFVIERPNELYKIVFDFLNQGIITKITVDDYWKTREGKKEIEEYKI